MILAYDIGNTNIVVGLLDGERIAGRQCVKQFRFNDAFHLAFVFLVGRGSRRASQVERGFPKKELISRTPRITADSPAASCTKETPPKP